MKKYQKDEWRGGDEGWRAFQDDYVAPGQRRRGYEVDDDDEDEEIDLDDFIGHSGD